MTASHTLCGECGSVLLVCSRPSCAKPFPRRGHEDELSWGKRVYCSVECAAAERQLVRWQDRILAEKPCGYKSCTKLARQRKNESPASFQKRKYCSSECGWADRRHGPISEREIRKRRRAEPGYVPPVRRPKEPEEGPPKPLIRPEVKVVQPQPDPGMWRPAAWRAMENSR